MDNNSNGSSNGHRLNGDGVHDNGQGSYDGGGQGEVLADPHHSRADARMVARAISKRWMVPDEVRAAAARRAGELAQSDDERRSARGLDLLLKMEGQNQTDEHHAAGPPEIVVRVLRG